MIVGLAAAQIALGHEVILISEDAENSAAVDAFIAAHLDTIPKRYSIQPRAFLSHFTRDRIIEALEGVDIAHLHGVWPIISMMVSRICRERGFRMYLHRTAACMKVP